MIDKLYFLTTKSTNPFYNLALEEYLLSAPSGQAILYIWQNENTVVIGKNQDYRAEVNLFALENASGRLARRLSGGGAVYHDLGNLNFTFIMDAGDFDVSRQLKVITHALSGFGIEALETGRNDIEAMGKKFSGNAFYRSKTKCYHHGTLLVCTDMARMGRFLNVSEDKMRLKGVKSVRSRVVNLKELNSEITIDKLRDALILAFGEAYGKKPVRLLEDDLDRGKISELAEKYASDKWRLGRDVCFETELKSRFSWGGISISLALKDGVIFDAEVFSDAMNENIGCFKKELIGCAYSKEAIFKAVESSKYLEPQMKDDIKSMFEDLR